MLNSSEFINVLEDFGNPFDFDFSIASVNILPFSNPGASTDFFTFRISGVQFEGLTTPDRPGSEEIRLSGTDIVFEDGVFKSGTIDFIQITDFLPSGLRFVPVTQVGLERPFPATLLNAGPDVILATLQDYLETGTYAAPEGLTGFYNGFQVNPFDLSLFSFDEQTGNQLIWQPSGGAQSEIRITFDPSDPIVLDGETYVSGTVIGFQAVTFVRGFGGSVIENVSIDIQSEPGFDATILNRDPELLMDAFLRALATGETLEDAVAGLTSGVRPDISGTDGDDLIEVPDGGARVFGLGGDDRIIGSDDDDLLLGEGLGNSANANPGDDVIYGRGGDDILSGGGGNDRLLGGTGDDRVTGGSGDDRLFGQSGDDDLRGGTGNDFLGGGTGDDILSGGEGDDRLSAGSGSDVLFGNNGNDTMFGGADNDTLRGGNGDDVLYGQAGSDEIIGDAGSDRLYGGDGDDFIYGETDAVVGDVDRMFGGDGNDEIYGGSTRDYIYGQNDDDLLYGNGGSDIIYGGNGNDQVYGGTGNDRLMGGTGEDTVYGGDGNDRILGGRDNDVLLGENGNDILNGGAGNDVLLGGDGDDTMIGGAGNDTFIGGAGTDIITTGSGYDDVRFEVGGGGDFVLDFQDGFDQIDLSQIDGVDANTNWQDVVGYGATEDGTGTVIWINDDFIILDNFDVSNLDASDFYVG